MLLHECLLRKKDLYHDNMSMKKSLHVIYTQCNEEKSVSVRHSKQPPQGHEVPALHGASRGTARGCVAMRTLKMGRSMGTTGATTDPAAARLGPNSTCTMGHRP